MPGTHTGDHAWYTYVRLRVVHISTVNDTHEISHSLCSVKKGVWKWGTEQELFVKFMDSNSINFEKFVELMNIKFVQSIDFFIVARNEAVYLIRMS
jgi:hypothetical protein